MSASYYGENDEIIVEDTSPSAPIRFDPDLLPTVMSVEEATRFLAELGRAIQDATRRL